MGIGSERSSRKQPVQRPRGSSGLSGLREPEGSPGGGTQSVGRGRGALRLTVGRRKGSALSSDKAGSTCHGVRCFPYGLALILVTAPQGRDAPVSWTSTVQTAREGVVGAQRQGTVASS